MLQGDIKRLMKNASDISQNMVLAPLHLDLQKLRVSYSSNMYGPTMVSTSLILPSMQILGQIHEVENCIDALLDLVVMLDWQLRRLITSQNKHPYSLCFSSHILYILNTTNKQMVMFITPTVILTHLDGNLQVKRGEGAGGVSSICYVS